MVKKWIGTLLKTVLPLLLGVYLVWYFFDSMSPTTREHFYRELKEANYFWIVLSLVMSFLALLSRAYRWKYTLEPLGYKTKFWNRYHALMIGYIMNLTIPRAGEATRAAMLYRSDGVPFSKSVGTIIAERAIDLVMLMAIVLFTAWIGYEDFWEIKYHIQHRFAAKPGAEPSMWQSVVFYTFILLFVAGLLALIFLEKLRTKVVKFIKEVFAGVFAIFRSRNPFSYAAHTLFIWASYLTYFWIAFWSLDETASFPFDGIMIGFVAGSLGITFTNGGIGAFPLVVGLVVAFFLGDELGEETAQGIGFAIGMIIWSSQTLMMILLGLLSLVLLPKNYSKKDEQAG